MSEGRLIASGGWCAPSENLVGADGVDCVFPFPEVTVKKGAVNFRDMPRKPKPQRAPLPEPPDGVGDGHWAFGILSDGCIHHGYSSFSSEPFYSPEEALDFWGELQEGEKIVRRWVPKPMMWEEHS